MLTAYCSNFFRRYCYCYLRVRTREKWVFFSQNFFFFLFQHLLMLIYTKISRMNTKRTKSTFKKTELLSILDFRHFWTTFVLFVLDSKILMLNYSQRPLKVTFHPYNKLRTQKVRSNDWKLTKSKKSFKHIWASNTWFRPIFFQFYLIGEDARP